MSRRTSWQHTVARTRVPVKTLAAAITAMQALAKAYPRVEVEKLTANDYRLLFPIESGIRRGMNTAPNFVFDVTGSHWDATVWSDAAFLKAHEALDAAEKALKDRLRTFAIASTRAFLDDPTWLDMMRAEAYRRQMSENALQQALSRARKDATTGLDAGWVWVNADDLIAFYGQLDDWRERAGRTSPLAQETAHAA